jgi:hypothetical protein
MLASTKKLSFRKKALGWVLRINTNHYIPLQKAIFGKIDAGKFTRSIEKILES